MLAGWWLVSRSARMLPHLERKPSHAITMMPLFVPLTFAMALVKIFALLTIRTQRWLTRDVEVSAKTKTVRRTVALPVVTALLVIALPGAGWAIERNTVRLEPDQFEIVTSPKQFIGSPRGTSSSGPRSWT